MITRAHKIKVGIFVGLSVLIISMVVYAFQIFQTPNVLVGENEEEKSVWIPPGSTIDEVTRILLSENIISDQLSFRFVSKSLGYNDLIKPGQYLFKPKMTNLQAVRMLRSGDQVPIIITFNNVRTREDLAGKITKHLQFDSTTFLNILSNPETVKNYGFDTTNILSMFLPNSYQVYRTITADELMNKMKKEYEGFWTSERVKKAQDKNLTPLQVSILASIVDAETIKEDEKPTVAGVYLNRLAKGWKLEADPTVVYAHRDFEIKRVLTRHLEYDSPYNTYLYEGLPPGPIRMPSISGIKAVLDAPTHDFMFFCAREDFSGYHNFAVTNAEHERNANKYRRALSQNKIF